jgi:hypothetical protein
VIRLLYLSRAHAMNAETASVPPYNYRARAHVRDASGILKLLPSNMVRPLRSGPTASDQRGPIVAIVAIVRTGFSAPRPLAGKIDR